MIRDLIADPAVREALACVLVTGSIFAAGILTVALRAGGRL